MGCCMGKYTTRPEKTSPLDDQISVRTQDKLVITQPPPPTTIPPSPLSSNFTPTTTTTTTTTSSSLDTAPRTSCSSATSCESKARDGAFSKDSVWASCVKENPHSVRRHPIQGSPLPPPRLDSPARRQRIPQPHKAEAARANSPAHHRSCHEGPTRPGSKLHRSTSPSRRYRGDKNWGSSPTRGNRGGTENRGCMEREVCSCCKRCSGCDGGFSSNEDAVSRNTTRFGAGGRLCLRRNGVAQQRCQEMECRGKEESYETWDRDSDIAEEDIDNPLIALDCFIFL